MAYNVSWLANIAGLPTTFPATESPISQGGIWVNGFTDGGGLWHDVRTVAPGVAAPGGGASSPGGAGTTAALGRAMASDASETLGSRYDDSIAHLKTSFRTFSPNQYAAAVIYRDAGYSFSGAGHESELLLRFAITPTSASGYEVIYSSDGWLVIVRWNGPRGNYSQLASSGGPVDGVSAANNDVIRAEIRSDNKIYCYKNGVLKLTGPTDTTYATGQPGMGFWPVDGNGANLDKLCWKQWDAGDLP